MACRPVQRARADNTAATRSFSRSFSRVIVNLFECVRTSRSEAPVLCGPADGQNSEAIGRAISKLFTMRVSCGQSVASPVCLAILFEQSKTEAFAGLSHADHVVQLASVTGRPVLKISVTRLKTRRRKMNLIPLTAPFFGKNFGETTSRSRLSRPPTGLFARRMLSSLPISPFIGLGTRTLCVGRMPGGCA